MRYNQAMYNWSGTDPSKFPTQEKREIWELEQLINFGLNGQKISRSKLKRHWSKLDLDPTKKKWLSWLLHHETTSPLGT